MEDSKNKSVPVSFKKVSSNIEKVDNRIYFYSGIGSDSILSFNKLLDQAAKESQITALKLGEDPNKVIVNIQSGGGAVVCGLSAADHILRVHQNQGIEVVTLVDGWAASAATFMSIVGSHRQMTNSSHMLIHQLSSMASGNYSQLKDDMKNCSVLMKRMKQLYRKHTKMDSKTINNLLKHDLYLDAKKCLELGLIDEIV